MLGLETPVIEPEIVQPVLAAGGSSSPTRSRLDGCVGVRPPLRYFSVMANLRAFSTSEKQTLLCAESQPAAPVKVCGWRPHVGGAAHSGAGVRKPPREMLCGGGEDITSIVADLSRWSTPCRS